jgi:hypothetical protein
MTPLCLSQRCQWHCNAYKCGVKDTAVHVRSGVNDTCMSQQCQRYRCAFPSGVNDTTLQPMFLWTSSRIIWHTVLGCIFYNCKLKCLYLFTEIQCLAYSVFFLLLLGRIFYNCSTKNFIFTIKDQYCIVQICWLLANPIQVGSDTITACLLWYLFFL